MAFSSTNNISNTPATATAINGQAAPSASSSPIASPLTTLSLDEIGKCNRGAQLDGVMYGSAAGFLGGFFSFRFLKLNKNVSLFSGILTGVISGYVVSRQALQTRLLRSEADARALSRQKDETKGGKWDMDRFEGGHGGLEHLEDKYATTSGEH